MCVQAKKKLVYDELHVGDLREWVAEQANARTQQLAQQGCVRWMDGWVGGGEGRKEGILPFLRLAPTLT
jgi:hypothetical protein